MNTTSAKSFIRAAQIQFTAAVAKKRYCGPFKIQDAAFVEISSNGSLISGKVMAAEGLKKIFEHDLLIRF